MRRVRGEQRRFAHLPVVRWPTSSPFAQKPVIPNECEGSTRAASFTCQAAPRAMEAAAAGKPNGARKLRNTRKPRKELGGVTRPTTHLRGQAQRDTAFHQGDKRSAAPPGRKTTDQMKRASWGQASWGQTPGFPPAGKQSVPLAEHAKSAEKPMLARDDPPSSGQFIRPVRNTP